MFFNKYKKKFTNTKRRYCDAPGIDFQKSRKIFNLFADEESLRNLILKNYFKIILEKVFVNFQKKNYIFEVFIYVDILKLVDSTNYAGCYITKNFVAFTNAFNEISYSLLSQFEQRLKREKPEDDMVEYLNIIISCKFIFVTLIPINTPIKTDCILNLGNVNNLGSHFYHVIELINATLMSKDKKSFLYKKMYMRVCECSKKYLAHQNIIVQMNKLGKMDDNKTDKEVCALCFTKQYEEMTQKRQFKNFYLLKFSFTRAMDEYSNRDECTTFEVLYQDVAEKNETFEIGMKYNLIVVSIPNQPNKNSIKGAHVGNLWLLNYRKDKTKKLQCRSLSVPEDTNLMLSTEGFNCLLQTSNLEDMNKIIRDILKLPPNNSSLSKICRTTKLTLILISICSNVLRYAKLDTFAHDLYNKLHTNKWVGGDVSRHALTGVRAPHCFFICLDEVIMVDLVKFCNYFCNISILHVKADSFNVLFTQKYDILVININNLNSLQINVLVELMKNGVYRCNKALFPVSTTFWIYAVKSYIRSEQEFNSYIKGNLLARFDFLFELSFDGEDDIIDEVLRSTDEAGKGNCDFYFELNKNYSYLKKSHLAHFEFKGMCSVTKSIIQKYFSMAADLSTLTVHHIGICELLCISASLLFKKKECLIEHAVLGLFLYDKFVSATKNKLTQFDKTILDSVMNSRDEERCSFQKLMNYFSSYLDATMSVV
ncbi:hypothetical protein C922_05110 [Plasmodium inui San Antonio 1]|uniref:Uncharacterized protein n=1 Tax=Plasmodium inui San Antonio 1 TaxID=1237626 RepID=W6ZYW4_9APIC|nr:hypothetical protein C922_05110 [Plasmodium inui San Antonio 1]EUD64503.1 hypothetical protein C922_05110 [Plasmodium inui San Antonio 1]